MHIASNPGCLSESEERVDTGVLRIGHVQRIETAVSYITGACCRSRGENFRTAYAIHSVKILLQLDLFPAFPAYIAIEVIQEEYAEVYYNRYVYRIFHRGKHP